MKRTAPGPGQESSYDDNSVPSSQGRGIFARALSEAVPLLPLEEEGQLNDPRLREHCEVPDWLRAQTYLDPYPRELMLRNHV